MPGQIHSVVKNSENFYGLNFWHSEYQEVTGIAFASRRMQCKNATPDFFSFFYTNSHWALLTQSVNSQLQGFRVDLGLKLAEVLSAPFDYFLVIPLGRRDESNSPGVFHALAIAFVASDFRCFLSNAGELKSVYLPATLSARPAWTAV